MSAWYQVFDNVNIQLVTRKQATQLSGLFTAAFGLTFLGIVLVFEAGFPLVLLGIFLPTVWIGVIWLGVYRLRILRHTVWCIKLSDREVVGYDYSRRKIKLDWIYVERIEITKKGMLIVGPVPCSLVVPHLFPDFAELSHLVLHYADFYEIPIFVNGEPWQQLDIFDLYPFLAELTSSETRNGQSDTPSR